MIVQNGIHPQHRVANPKRLMVTQIAVRRFDDRPHDNDNCDKA
jgi:hypothetical protein